MSPGLSPGGGIGGITGAADAAIGEVERNFQLARDDETSI